MRSLAALLVASLFVGCGSERSPSSQPQAANPGPIGQASADPDVKLLLTASAKDFKAHQPPYPSKFREVRVGYNVASDGTKKPLLRGQFLPKDGQPKPEWTHFATIKTSDYEQLIGAQAEGYCRQPSITWDDREDLSSSLQSQLESLPSQGAEPSSP